MNPLSVPTKAALPPTHRVPANNPSVSKTLQRLSRASLLSLVLDWLDDRNQTLTAPYLLSEDEDEDEDEQDLYPACASLDDLREIYTSMQAKKGSKRDVVDRVLEGDWRDGITLYQLAMADMQYLYDHPTSQKWTALKIIRLSNQDTDDGSRPEEKKAMTLPRLHPATFLRNLQQESLPDVKAHYNLDRHPTLPLLILRIFTIDTPYNTHKSLQAPSKTAIFDSSKTFYVAFPDASPYIYVSLTTSTGSSISSDAKSLRKLTLDGIPKAFSRPRERYALESTNLSSKNLGALVDRRGGGRTNAAGGGWSVYAEDDKKDTPLDNQLPTPKESVHASDDDDQLLDKPRGMKRKIEEDPAIVKRRKTIAQSRFGNSAKPGDGKGIERLDVRIEDPFPTLPQTDPEAEVDDLEPPPEPVVAPTKKSKGRRSTISAELDRRDDEVEEEGGPWRPDIRVTFHSDHVFSGIRKLVEMGIVDGEKMPGWMTGEDGVSVGVVRNGRIRGYKGSGI